MSGKDNTNSNFVEESVDHWHLEKKEEILLRLMKKAPTPTENSKKQSDNTKTPPKLRLNNDCGLT